MSLYSFEGHEPDRTSGFSWVAPSASVIGKVVIGLDVSIWFGAVIRGDNEAIDIGDRSNIQDNVVMHTDPGFPLVIAKGCTIGHKAILHGCVIGENTLIGMNATVLNGARIGNNCLIGAGALVREGMQIPDNSLVVGMPGKIIRQLDGEAVEFLKSAADVYVEKARRYAKALRQL